VVYVSPLVSRSESTSKSAARRTRYRVPEPCVITGGAVGSGTNTDVDAALSGVGSALGGWGKLRPMKPVRRLIGKIHVKSIKSWLQIRRLY
jgi:hypothetical protein